MNGTKIALLGVLVLLALLVAAIALRNPKPPYLPADPVHDKPGLSSTCLTCHGHGMPAARSAKHPAANDCMRCHARR